MRLQHFYTPLTLEHNTHYNIFWTQARRTEPNRPITHAMSIIMLRTLYTTTTTKKWSTITHFALKWWRSRRWFGCSCDGCRFYNILYEKFIKLGKLRDGNLCALNLFLNSKWPKFSNTNIHITQRENEWERVLVSHDLILLIEQWEENKQMLLSTITHQ